MVKISDILNCVKTINSIKCNNCSKEANSLMDKCIERAWAADSYEKLTKYISKKCECIDIVFDES